MTVAAPSKPVQYVQTIFADVLTHIEHGHSNPSHVKYPDFITDLETAVINAHRVLWAVKPPATEHEQLSFLVTHADVLEKLMATVREDIAAAVATVGQDATDAANRVIETLNTDRAAVADAQAAQKTAEDALAAAIADGIVSAADAAPITDALAATSVALKAIDTTPVPPVV